MTSALDNSGGTSSYTYNADGQRVRRTVGGQPSPVETWQIYGPGGELLAEYAAGVSYTTPQKEYGYRNGQLLITAEPGSNSANVATYLQTDIVSQGNWKGVHGGNGYGIPNDAASYPSYAQVSYAGVTSYTWSASTADVRAPLKAASATDRAASCWYSNTNFTIDVNLTDGASHQLGLYALDWDSLGRQQRVEVLDATSNAVLDTREVTSFSGGKYLVWELKGHVKLKVTNLGLAGTNAVLSGLFFEADTNAGFVTTDATAQGSWKGAHGGNGYDLPNDAASYPSYAQVSYTGMTSYTWSASTADVRAPLKAASTTDRAASCRYSYTSFTIDVNLTDGLSHQVALYALDWDSLGRQQRVEVLDAPSNATLDTRDLSSFAGGKYLVWILKGHLKLKVTNLGPPGTNAVISGLFFDALQNSNAGKINWLVTDQLGTPRMIFDQSGSLANVKRHDYLPFGEELFAGQGGRTTTQGYSAADGVRQKFTLKERDIETGLDYFGARYYGSTQGRFTSADPLMSSGTIYDPQSWNRYSYTSNNPLRFVDPTGMWDWDASAGGSDTDAQLEAKRHDKSLKKKERNAAKDALKYRQRFRDALAGATALAQSGRLNAGQQAEVSRAVNSYGTEGDGNKVFVAFGPQRTGTGADTDGTAADNSIVVTFGRGAKGFDLIADVAHEGSHVLDNQSFDLLHSNGGMYFDGRNGDISQYETERRAYEVTSLAAQAADRGSYLNDTPSYEVWSSGWKAAERETKRARGIDRVISANYGVSPTNPGWTFGQIKSHVP